MRKRPLYQEIHRHYHRLRQGSVSTRHEQKKVMLRVVKDWQEVGLLGRSFKNLSAEDVGKLVKYWRKQGISDTTIRNDLGRIRTFFKQKGWSASLPSNQALGLKRASKKTHSIGHENLVDQVYHPVVKTIMRWQCAFGLTPHESMKVPIPERNMLDEVYVSHRVASNSKPRHIPIVDTYQHNAVDEREALLQGQETLSNILSLPCMQTLYKAECVFLGWIPKLCFRSVYAHRRWQMLSGTMGEPDAIARLQLELGTAQKKSVEDFLREYQQNQA